MKAKPLTPKQLHFARCIAQGMSQSAAYKEAFDVGDSTTQASVHTLASRMMGRVEVRSRVDALIAARERAVAQSAVTDREKVTEHLRGALAGTIDTDSNRLRAAELLGKASGLFTTDVTVTTKERDSSEVAAEIQEKLSALIGAEEIEEESPESLH